jgi:hypothetical protein
MRRIRFTAATVMVAAGLLGAGAAGATAAPPANYGHCVSNGFISPSDGGLGPENSNAHVPSGAANAVIQSGGNSHFTGAEGCAP